MRLLADLDKVDRPDAVLAAKRPENGEQAEQEAEVTHAVHDKGFFRRIAGTLLLEIVTDQQVGTETDAFPADKHDQGVVPQHQHDHGEDEQVQVTEEAVEPLLAVHVTDRVEMNEGTDPADDHQHDRGEGSNRNPQSTCRLPTDIHDATTCCIRSVSPPN